MDEHLYQLFRDCTVGLKTPTDNGTGFFVAPGLILTCFHVVKETQPGEINISWQHGDYSATDVHPLPDADLALVGVSLTEHPCVWLDRGVMPFDDLYAFGFPQVGSEGSALCRCEGTELGEKFLSIVGESVRQGLSGSPLLNQRTQKVCAIVNQSLKVKLPGSIFRGFGGRAIPATHNFVGYRFG